MRVLLTTDAVGGVWTFTKELTTGLLERGHAVALVSVGRQPSASQRGWVAQVRSEYPTAFHYEASDAPLEWMADNNRAYSDVEDVLLRLVHEAGVEVAHLNQFCFGALPVDLPKVVTAHSDVLSWAEACRPGGLEESQWLRTYRALVNAGLEGADAVTAPTRWMGEALSKHFPASDEARVIMNGRTLKPVAAGIPRDLQAITVGRVWDEAKGLAVLDEIDAEMSVLAIGETSFQEGCAVGRRGVDLLGRLDEDALLDTLRRSSLYLATSIYEPFGLAPLEAALCGCGVVARDIGSLREVWGDGAEYFSDAAQLSGLLLRLKQSSPDLRDLQDRSERRALELSAGRMVDAYESLYSELLSGVSRSQEEAAVYAV